MATTSSKAKISERLLNMSQSATIAMAQMARDLTAKGHNVISLSLGEPDFDTPDHIKEAAKQALDDGYTKYTPVNGLVELREAISTKFKRDNDLDYAIDEIVVSNGAKQSIANISLSLLNEGDEVIILTPYWVSYFEIVKLGGGVPVPVFAGIDKDYKVTAEQIEAAITDKTRFILFSSPCNPTGSVYSYEELESIANVVAKYDDILIVSDEIYEYITFVGKHISIGSFPAVKDRTITVNGFAKGFAMTGWRLGYMGAPKWVAAACAKMQGQFTSGANAFGQKAAAHALMSDMSPTYKMREAFKSRKALVIKLLKEIPGFNVNDPDGAFYVFPEISHYIGKKYNEEVIGNDADFCMYLLKNCHVAVVQGSAFGAPGCFRLSYAASEEDLIEAIRRIKECVGKLS